MGVRKVTGMADNNNVLEQIKLDLESCVGKRVKLKANRGRKKVVEAEGIIENTYPKLFVVKLDKSNSIKRLSYTYADVLTRTVEVIVDDTVIGAANL
ncbi:MAG: Veg family protein [Limnochordia bacterium]